MDQYQRIRRDIGVSGKTPEHERSESVASQPLSGAYNPITPLPESAPTQPLFSVQTKKGGQEAIERRSESKQQLLEYYVSASSYPSDAYTGPITIPGITAQIDTDKIVVPTEKVQDTSSAYTSYIYEGDFPTISILVFVIARHEEKYKAPPEALHVSKRFLQYISAAYRDYFKKDFEGTIPSYRNGPDIPLCFLNSISYKEVGCIRRCSSEE